MTGQPVAPPAAAPAKPPLSRNRDYRLLWTSQALAEFGVNATIIAFPLLVLALTGSAAASGLVLGTIAAAQLAAGLPAGALVDRWNRKRLMLGCEAAQAVAAASLVAVLLWGTATVPHLVAVAAVFGLCAALFEPAEESCLPNLVEPEQLPTAIAMNSARGYLGHLSGTAAGGFLFTLGRFVPFAADVVTHTAAFCTLAFVRVPARAKVEVERKHLGREIADGLRWVWRHQHIRVTMLCAVVLNLFFSAFYIVVIVLAQRRGVPSGQIGIMAAMLGIGGIAGALLAPYLHRVLSPYQSIAGVFWALTVLTPAAVFVHNGYAMGGLFAAMALLPPAANTTIMTQQLLLTPDHLRGRLSSVLGLVTGVAATIGPVLGGVLAQTLDGSRPVLVCAVGMAVVTVAVTASGTLRGFPTHQTAATDVAADPSHNHPKEMEMDDNARYEVLRNDEDQYSLWLAGQEVPAGWHRVGREGSKEECSAYVDEVWTDMRPRSLREQMDGAASS
ncbi:MAG TPA: MFS transporter [Mycobacteriales bacterium]|nr:MFS transporter [Mycobacteriales bacterium]